MDGEGEGEGEGAPARRRSRPRLSDGSSCVSVLGWAERQAAQEVSGPSPRIEAPGGGAEVAAASERPSAGSARAGPSGRGALPPVLEGDLQLRRWLADLRGFGACARGARPGVEDPESTLVRLAAHLLARYRRKASTGGAGGGAPQHQASHAKMRFKIEARQAQGRAVDEAACLWLALKLHGEQVTVPGAERVAAVAGARKVQLMRAEAHIAETLRWKLLDGFLPAHDTEAGGSGTPCVVY